MHPLNDFWRDFGKDGIALDGIVNLDLRDASQPFLEARGHSVCMFCVAQPGAILEHANPGSGQKTHF
jgi:hypothetical protein